MLKLIDQKPREDDPVYQEIMQLIAQCDGFLALTVKDGNWKWNRYNLSHMETAYALLQAQHKLGSEIID